MKRCRPLLGTFVDIAVRDALPEPVVAAAIERAFEAVARVERLMSFHDPASELSRLNAAHAGDVLALDPWTHEVLALAGDLREATGGSFDPNVGAVLVRWGLLPDHRAGAAHAGAEASVDAEANADADTCADTDADADLDRPSLDDLAILSDHRVRVRAPVCIDLGGIAKGFAVDKAVEALRESGIRQADVNAGGDLRVLGDARPVHVRRPDDPTTLVALGDLGDGALATSANYYVGARQAGQWRGALIDPRSRRAVAGQRSFSVVAPRCAVADGLTKALAAAGRLPDACLQRYDARSIVL